MSQPAANTISHDAAARVLKLAPADLARLVESGAVPRVAKDAYALIPLVHGYLDHLRAQQQRIIQRPTQAEIAEHLDISDRRVRELATEWGIDSKDLSLSAWRLRYLRHLREQAAGRAAAGDLDLAVERARLAKEQADKLAMQNAVTRRELAPIHILEEILTSVGARVAKLLDTIPGELRRRVCGPTAEDVDTIASIIAKARNQAAAINLAALEEPDPDQAAEADAAGEADTQRINALLGETEGDGT